MAGKRRAVAMTPDEIRARDTAMNEKQWEAVERPGKRKAVYDTPEEADAYAAGLAEKQWEAEAVPRPGHYAMPTCGPRRLMTSSRKCASSAGTAKVTVPTNSRAHHWGHEDGAKAVSARLAEAAHQAAYGQGPIPGLAPEPANDSFWGAESAASYYAEHEALEDRRMERQEVMAERAELLKEPASDG